jgi:phosphate transport system ATP-binding protein
MQEQIKSESQLGINMDTTKTGAAVQASKTLTSVSNQKLAARDLNFFYGTFQALHSISINIHTNCVTAFIGPSGCGKSTFLRTLNRMYETVRNSRVEGEILLDGNDIFGLEVSHLRRRVGMVFQKSNPFPKSIFENVAYGLRINGFPNKAALRDSVEKSLRRAAIWEEVKDKLKGSCTIVIVTHNMQQAARVADYTGFFLMGKMIEFNNTPVIFKNPAHKETEDYVTGRFG